MTDRLTFGRDRLPEDEREAPAWPALEDDDSTDPDDDQDVEDDE